MNMKKMCPKCFVERENRDFLLSDICYKCVYQLKKSKLPVILEKKCPICSAKIPSSRWVYCSHDCAEIAEIKRQKNYWIKNL